MCSPDLAFSVLVNLSATRCAQMNNLCFVYHFKINLT